MSIEFQDENFSSNRFNQNGSSASGSKMVDFLIKQGIVKDQSAANAMLIIASLLFIALSIYFFVYGFSLPQREAVTPQRPLPSANVEL